MHRQQMQRQAYGYDEPYGLPYPARHQQHPQHDPHHQYLYEHQQPQMPPHHQHQHQHPQQQPMQRRRFPQNMNQFMDHAGKVSEGINIMRQIGAFFNMFR